MPFIYTQFKLRTKFGLHTPNECFITIFTYHIVESALLKFKIEKLLLPIKALSHEKILFFIDLDAANNK